MPDRRAALGVLIAAIAVLGSSASPAAAANFTAGEYPASLEAGPGQATTHILILPGGRHLTCSTAKFTGELKNASTELTLLPEYGGCFMELLGTVHNAMVTVGGCDYGFTASSATEGSLSVKCKKEEEAIVIDVEEICKYKISPQGPLKGLTFKNLGGTAGFKVTTAISGIKYSRISGTATNCGNSSGEASYEGASIFTAKSAETSLEISADVG